MAVGRIVIDGARAEVMAVLADLPAMLEWTTADRVEVLDIDAAGRPAAARWQERYGPLRDEFELQYSWHDDGVGWRLTQGRILKTEDGRYTVTAVSTGTAVVYNLRLGLAVWLPACVRSRIESAVVESTLSALKRRIEQS